MGKLVDFNLGDVGGIFTSIREAWTGEKIIDPTAIAEIDYKLDVLEQAINMGQIAINKQEAKSASIFVAGWRPFIGWVGGSALAYTYIVQPLLSWILNIFILFNKYVFTAEELEALKPLTLDTGLLLNLVLALLGFGGMRTYEKFKNVDTKTKDK